jgi:hypothetical protein
MIQIRDESATGHALLRVDDTLLFQAPQCLTNRSPACHKLFGQGPLIWQPVPYLEFACKDRLSYLLEDFIGNSLVFDWLKHLRLASAP